MCSCCVFSLNNSCLRSYEVILGESKIPSTYGQFKAFLFIHDHKAYVKSEHLNQHKLVISINKGNSKGKFEKHELAILFFFFSLAISCPYQRLQGCFSFSNRRLRKDFNISQIEST